MFVVFPKYFILLESTYTRHDFGQKLFEKAKIFPNISKVVAGWIPRPVESAVFLSSPKNVRVKKAVCWSS